MSKYICLRCRASLLQLIRPKRSPIANRRPYSSSRSPPKEPLDIGALLSTPTWSVRSLLPSSPPKEEITPTQLHHLLRLSALPQPKTPEEEAKMLETLHSQLHFVRDIQSVDTEGVEPLQSIRDETEEGIKEATIGLEDMREALGEERFVGRNRRPRRRRGVVEERGEVEGWDVMSTAGETIRVGGSRYFVVRSGKNDPMETSAKDISKDEGRNDDTPKE